MVFSFVTYWDNGGQLRGQLGQLNLQTADLELVGLEGAAALCHEWGALTIREGNVQS